MNTKFQENAYDELARFWGVRIQRTGWYNHNKVCNEMHYAGWYNKTSWLFNLIRNSSGTTTVVYKLPKGCVSKILSKPIQSQITMNIFYLSYAVEMKKLTFLEYNKNKFIDGQMDYVLDGDNK